jgi:hypothetical protein
MITLETLGLTKEEIADRIVKHAATDLLNQRLGSFDEDGVESEEPTAFAEAMKKAIAAKVNEAIEQIAAKNVLPNVAAYVEGLCLQETNRWGEKTGKALTFTEYLTARAEAYLREEVNYDGKAKHEDSFGSWKSAGTRVSYLINKHLQYSIETAMKAALTTANSAIVGGIEQAIKIKLAEVQSALKVTVTTK